MSWCSCRAVTGVPPVNHAQDARATFTQHYYLESAMNGHTFRNHQLSALEMLRRLNLFCLDRNEFVFTI